MACASGKHEEKKDFSQMGLANDCNESTKVVRSLCTGNGRLSFDSLEKFMSMPPHLSNIVAISPEVMVHSYLSVQ